MEKMSIGMDCGLYLGDPPGAEMQNIKDATLNLEANEVDLTTRASGGWREFGTAINECNVEFEMHATPGETFYDSLAEAYRLEGKPRMSVLSARRQPGAEGIVGDFSVTGFTHSQPLDGGQTVAVTAKLHQFITWLRLEVFQRKVFVLPPPFSLQLFDTSIIADATIVCPPGNNAGIQFSIGDPENTTVWQPGESHTFQDIDLSQLNVKGIPPDSVITRATVWREV